MDKKLIWIMKEKAEVKRSWIKIDKRKERFSSCELQSEENPNQIGSLGKRVEGEGCKGQV